VENTAPFYAMADVVVLPSHREGLPTVVLEAQAAGKPVVGASATGIVDLIIDGETGLLFPVGDVAGLAEALSRMITDKALASELAHAGQERVMREFRQQQIWDALCREYLRLLNQRNLPAPFLKSSEDSRDLVARSK
jgi:glycosyltransferase involved in cell wall biosynthesis